MVIELIRPKISCKAQIGRSELEGGLNKATEVGEGIATGNCTAFSTEGSAEVVDGGGDADVVGNLELVPPLPGVVAVVGLAFELAGGEGGLTKGHAQGVALEEGIGPLQAHVPVLSCGDFGVCD